MNGYARDIRIPNFQGYYDSKRVEKETSWNSTAASQYTQLESDNN